ncbi:MAG TPA: VOC family protein, partial [Gaiellaceae bacterium]|nr:VOC family protein [Gaiellaceae bacterium]
MARRLDPAANRAHIDIGVDDVDRAIERIEAIGGRLKYQPTVYPVPHAYDGARPLIDWAVMQDP